MYICIDGSGFMCILFNIYLYMGVLYVALWKFILIIMSLPRKLYIWLHACIYIYSYICICLLNKYVYLYIYIYICTRRNGKRGLWLRGETSHVILGPYISIYTCIYIYIYIYVCVCACMYGYVYICMCIYIKYRIA